MSVTEPSYVLKRRYGYQTGGRRLALRAGLRLPVGTLAWLGRLFICVVCAVICGGVIVLYRQD